MRIVRPNWRENKRICVALTVLGNNVAFTFHRLLTKAGSWHLFFKSLYHGNIQNLNDEEKMAKNWARGDGEGGRANSADWKLDTILIATTIVIAIIVIKIVTIVCQLSPIHEICQKTRISRHLLICDISNKCVIGLK